MNKLAKIISIAGILLAAASCSWLGLNKSSAPGTEKNPLVVPPVYNVRPQSPAAAEIAIEQDGKASGEEVNELNNQIEQEIQKLNHAE